MGPLEKAEGPKSRVNVAALDTLGHPGVLELDEAQAQEPVGRFGNHGAPLETHFSSFSRS